MDAVVVIDSLIDEAVSLETQLADGSLMRAIILTHEDEVLNANREMLYSGRTRTGASIVPPYSERTVKRKMRKSQPYDRVTLRDTGEFYRSLTLDVTDGYVGIDSDDPKAKYLVGRYGEDIFGLSDEALANLNDIVREQLQRYVYAKMTGNYFGL